MERMTPTGWAHAGGRRIRLLGSTEAVLAALAAAPGTRPRFIVVAADQRERVLDQVRAQGGRKHIAVVTAYTCPPRLWDFTPGTFAGVDVDAWHGIPGSQWAEIQRILQTRFAGVFWG